MSHLHADEIGHVQFFVTCEAGSHGKRYYHVTTHGMFSARRYVATDMTDPDQNDNKRERFQIAALGIKNQNMATAWDSLNDAGVAHRPQCVVANKYMIRNSSWMILADRHGNKLKRMETIESVKAQMNKDAIKDKIRHIHGQTSAAA